MSILSIILILCAVGVLTWLINSYIPMDIVIKRILNCVIIIFLIIWLLRAFGIWGEIAKVHI